jgi:hypothetical protein
MPAQVVDHYEAVLAYLRDKYWDADEEEWDVAELRTMRDTAFAAATRTVTITSTSTEAGGAGAGEITFDKMTLVAALNDLIAEADPSSLPPPRGGGFQADFSQRYSST